MKKQKYGNIFIYGTLQFAGNTEEYFSNHSKKVVVFIVLPKLNNTGNIIRVYKKGTLESETTVRSSNNFFLYYGLWYIQYLTILLTRFSRNEKITVISGHPISFLGMSLQKLLRKITYVYWVCDYFPPNTVINKVFMRISFFYHNRIDHRLYLSDTLNKKMNGKIINTASVKTIMWGVKERRIDKRKDSIKKFSLCFVGVIRPSQGLDETLQVIKELPFTTLRIIGACDSAVFSSITRKIKKYKVSERVFFPNKFVYKEDLRRLITDSSVGVALYDVGPEHGTFYADPAKIKTYTEHGLPILMTNAADIAKYIEKFAAGEVVERNITEMKEAVIKLRNNYNKYLSGVERFNSFFAFEKYYSQRFKFLESI